MAAEFFRVLSESLQTTSRALSVKGKNEEALLQESAVQMLGDMLLEGTAPLNIGELDPADLTRRVRDMRLDDATAAKLLREVRHAAWLGVEGRVVLMQAIDDADDWQGMPIVLQNFVTRAQMPCHIAVLVKQMELEGDQAYRHYALPVMVLLSAREGGLRPSFALGTKSLRGMDANQVQELHGPELEPFMRLIAGAIATSMALKT